MFVETLAYIINFPHFAGLYPLIINMLKHRPLKKKKKTTPHPLHPNFFPFLHSLTSRNMLNDSTSSPLLVFSSWTCSVRRLCPPLTSLPHFTCPRHGHQRAAQSSPTGPLSSGLFLPPVSNTDMVGGPSPPPWNASSSHTHPGLSSYLYGQSFSVTFGWMLIFSVSKCQDVLGPVSSSLYLHSLSRWLLPAPGFNHNSLAMPTFVSLGPPLPEQQAYASRDLHSLFAISAWRSCSHLSRHVQMELLSPSFLSSPPK